MFFRTPGGLKSGPHDPSQPPQARESFSLCSASRPCRASVPWRGNGEEVGIHCYWPCCTSLGHLNLVLTYAGLEFLALALVNLALIVYLFEKGFNFWKENRRSAPRQSAS